MFGNDTTNTVKVPRKIGHRLVHWLGLPIRLIRQERRIWTTAVGVAGGVILLRLLPTLAPGTEIPGLQSAELAALDQLIRMRPHELMDDRIVVVGFDEGDISQLKTHTLSDQIIAEVLNNIKAQNPRVIGLDIYREYSYGDGQDALEQVFTSTPNLIGIEKIADQDNDPVPPPPLLAERDQVGFNNVILDPDSRVRRSLLYWSFQSDIDGDVSTPETQTTYKTSFALKVALAYLKEEGIIAQGSSSGELKLDQTVFRSFHHRDGGYTQVDSGGYQLLANFRNADQPFHSISLTDVLSGNIPPDLMANRVVLVGSTAPSLKDIFYTSYNGGLTAQRSNPISGVELHGHIVSQILSATLDGRALLQVWPEPIENVWILVWSFVGAVMSWKVRSPTKSGGLLLLTGGGLFGMCYLAFLGGWWIPFVPPLVALGLSAIAIISHIAHLEGELQKSKEFLNSVINSIPDPIFVKDKDYRWVVLNEAYCQFIGHAKEELLEKTESDVLPSPQAYEFRAQDELTFATNGSQESEGELTNAQGYTYNVAMKRTLHQDGAGNLFLVGVIHDITHRKRMEEELRRTAAELVQSNAELRQVGDNWKKIAYHDPLTGLPNRKLFQEQLIQAIEWAETNEHVVALLFLDLDGFKIINDTAGHVVGDLLLKSVAQRLKGCLRGSDTVARLGGDEFVVILPGIPDTQVGRVAKKILDTLAQPFVIQSKTVSITTSIGISLYPFDGKGFEQLIVEADQAMYRSKESGKNQYTFAGYEPSFAMAEEH